MPLLCTSKRANDFLVCICNSQHQQQQHHQEQKISHWGQVRNCILITISDMASTSPTCDNIHSYIQKQAITYQRYQQSTTTLHLTLILGQNNNNYKNLKIYEISERKSASESVSYRVTYTDATQLKAFATYYSVNHNKR